MISSWLTAWGHTLYSTFVTAALAIYWWRHHHRRPKPPCPGKLIITVKGNRMFNVTAPWTKSPSSNVEQYTVLWVRTPAGGVPGSPVAQNVPQSNAQDASGYSADFNTGNSGTTLAPGDVVSASIVADDTVNNVVSTPAAELPTGGVTIPVPPPPPPPEPPVAGTLTVTGP